MIQKRNVTKIFALIITLGVLIALLISAPAQAYILSFNISDENVNKGEIVNFTASIQIEPQDRANITSIQLKLMGPLDIICKFKPNGEIIEGCNGIIIQKISNCLLYSGYENDCLSGYYGNNSDLKYNITYNTSVNFAGLYKTSLVVMSGNSALNSIAGKTLNVLFPGYDNQTKYCSIRAKNGDAEVGGTNFGEINKINFYIPQKGARPGTGYITGQKGRTTFSYKFTVIDRPIERDVNHTAVSVSGKYKIGLGSEIEEKSVLLLDKRTGSLDVIGKNVQIEYMDVNFNQGAC
ncbi:hypothetical protein J4218_03325 [Candidatus Pacearchaeota archaeon]|nr:hypothetical protein [Candidatus Pacearchaeota archaeon]